MIDFWSSFWFGFELIPRLISVLFGIGAFGCVVVFVLFVIGALSKFVDWFLNWGS